MVTARFPLQQKLLMASLLLMVKKGKTKEVTLGKLMETYAKVCKKRKMGVAGETQER
jgi:cell division control protein 6